MKILIATVNYNDTILGGGQLSVRSLVKSLVNLGHEVTIVCIDPDERSGIDEIDGYRVIKLRGRNIYSHAVTNKPFFLKALWHFLDRHIKLYDKEFESIVNDFKPDIIHTNVLSGLTAGIWRVAKGKSIPVFHTVHDFYLLCVNSGMRKGGVNCNKPCNLCKIYSHNSKLLANSVSGVSFVSQYMKSKHLEVGLFKDDCYQTVIIGSYEPKSDILRADYNGTPLRIGFLGRVTVEKGVTYLIKQLKKLGNTNYVLRIGGSGDANYIHQLKELADGMPVCFLGRVSPEDFFADIDLLIVPSLWNEPAGRVVFEAGLYNIPSVVSNRGGLPEMTGFGSSGWIFEPDEEGSLINIIDGLIKDRHELIVKSKYWDNRKVEFMPNTVCLQTLYAYNKSIECFSNKKVK